MITRILPTKITVVALLSALPIAAALAQGEHMAREEAADAVATAFIRDLGTVLKTNMAEGGPAAAIIVCREIAPTIANGLSIKNGWKVTRVGTRVRNTMMGIPDSWERKGLDYFSEEIDAGAAFEDTSFTEVVIEGGQRYFRFMKPIVTQPLCLSCHGTSDTIAPTIQAILNEHYPHDRAINYTVGELRGAVSIKQPMD